MTADAPAWATLKHYAKFAIYPAMTAYFMHTDGHSIGACVAAFLALTTSVCALVYYFGRSRR